MPNSVALPLLTIGTELPHNNGHSYLGYTTKILPPFTTEIQIDVYDITLYMILTIFMPSIHYNLCFNTMC